MTHIFKPTPLALYFTRSRSWTLTLDRDQQEFLLSLDGKQYRRAIADGEEPVLVRPGIFWAGLTLHMDGLSPIKVDGLSRRRARALQAAIADAKAAAEVARRRAALQKEFNAAYAAISAWVKDVIDKSDAILKKMGWVAHEDQMELFATRPKLVLSDDVLISYVRDPANQATLPDARKRVETFVSFRRDEWLSFCRVGNVGYIENEKNWPMELFERVESKPLTPDQIRAVMCFDNRMLVVASAGSGKTATMVAKAVYAVHRHIVRPEQILLLAFNKKAAEELDARAKAAFEQVGLQGDKVEAQTFHGLGLSIIGKATGRKPNVPEWTVDVAAGMRKLAEIVDNLKDRSREFRTRWDLFRVVFGRDLPEFESPSSSADVWDRDGVGYIQTIRGERVRSHEERLICDWLFYNGVNYEYERKYEFDTTTAEHRQYTPDFYYPEAQLYHEHFALNAKGEPPVKFTAYLQGVEWKRAEHARRGTKLIETTSHQLRTRSLDDVLGKELTARGMALDPNPDRTSPGLGYPPMDNERLIALVRIFITHMKSNCLSVDTLVERLDANRSDAFIPRHRMFLEIVGPVLRAWDDALAAEEGVDFEDMLNQAAAHLESGHYDSHYQLVMADEFQDASRARARLCRALVSRRGRFFFAVGDDWQSINRFAGADVSVMTRFDEWYGQYELMKLEETFRCPQALCDISSRFIRKNPNQLAKKVHSMTAPIGPVIRAFQVGQRGELRAAIDSVLEELHRGVVEGAIPPGKDGIVTVFVLGRYNKEESYVPSNWNARYGRHIALTFMSIHRSKGAQADYVILPGMLSSSFPSTRVDDPVLAMAMPSGDAYPLGEERRLFYVALTRARRSVVLLTVRGEASSFLDELVKDGAVTIESTAGEVIEEERCPACGIGVIVLRTGPYGAFEACSAYPRCEYKPRRRVGSQSTVRR
ncbi:UvrD-helicase domain-containing protein [Paraburkholderia nodosa]|uniref:UvrD-helicase domain-containing protein n=1 Tax=Paraburkholderia nodosa TaxID=392320 RepID=UPI00048A30B1|nr:UvrD-helicase domain-containing protein [Paraburkholderia nodosa]